MDLNSMKRKDLQALCKKHGIPANTTNSLMIDSLSSILQEKTKPKGCLKGSGGSSAEDVGVVRGGLKKVTFVSQDEESTISPVGKSKRKYARRSSNVASESDKGRKEIESPKQVDEVPRRATRSRGLAESLVWSPVVRKKSVPQDAQQNAEVKHDDEGMKNVDEVPRRATRSRVLGSPVIDKEAEKDSTGGVRRNAKEKTIVAQVPATRSLRNRVVVVGKDEESNINKNARSSQKRIHDVKKEEEAVGKKARNKRSREEDEETVGDELPSRKFTRSHAKTEENVGTEELDAGRSKKRRRVIGEETERVLKAVVTAKRSRGSTFDSKAVESGNVTGPATRSTHGSLALSEIENLTFAVGRSDTEGSKAVKKRKPGKPAKRRGSTSLLAEPARRSTRISSSLAEEETSIKGGELARKGKSEKQATVLSSSDVAAVSVRRSALSVSDLQEDKASAVFGGRSVERGKTVGKSRMQKQAKEERGSKGGVLQILSPVTEVAAEPPRRSTRHSSNMTKEGISLPIVGKGKSRTGSTGGGSSMSSLVDDGVLVEPVRRSARSSPSLLEKKTSPFIGKPVKQGKSAMKSKSQASEGEISEAIVDPEKSLICSSPKMLEDESHVPAVGKPGVDNEAIGNNKVRKRRRDHRIEKGDSTAILSDSKADIIPTGRSTCDHGDTVRTDKSLKKLKARIVEEGGLTTSSLDNNDVATPGRRSTRQSVAVPADVEALKSPFSPHLDNKSVRTPASRLTRHSSKVLSDSDALKSPLSSSPDNGHSLEPAGSEVLECPRSPHLIDEDVTTASRSSTRHLSKSSADVEVMKSLFSLNSDTSLLEDITEDAHGETRSSLKEATDLQEVQVDMSRTFTGGTDIVGQTSAASLLDTTLGEINNDVDTDTASQMRQSPESALPEEIECGTFLGSLKDLDNVGAHIIGGHSLIEAVNNTRDESPLNIAEGFSEIQEDFSGELRSSNIVAAGTLESYGDGRDTVLAPVDPTSSTIDSKKASVGVLHVDGLASIESENVISPLVPPTNSEEQLTTFNVEISTMAGPNSNVEVHPDREDILTVHTSVPQLQCNSSGEQSMTSGAEASLILASKGPTLDLESCGATEAGLQDNDAIHITIPALVGKNSEELLPVTCYTDASSVIDAKETRLRVEFDGPREDFMSENGADKIMVASNAEGCSESYSLMNKEESDSKLEVHIETKRQMEDTEAANNTGSPLSCASAGVLSPALLPTLHNEFSSEIGNKGSDLVVQDQDVSKVASDFGVSLVEASGTHSKTSEVSMTAVRASRGVSNVQRSFDAEVENGKVDADTILTAQLVPEICDTGENIEAFIAGSESLSCIGVEVSREVGVSSTLSETVNIDDATKGNKSGAEMNGDEPKPSSPNENPTCDLATGDFIKEGGSPLTAQLAPGEYDAGEKIEASITGSEPQSCICVEVIKETWVSSTSSVMVNDDGETERAINGSGKNRDKLRPSSPSENPACDLGTGDYMKEGGSPISTSPLVSLECVTGEMIEASVAGSESQLCVGVGIIKETCVSSTLSVTTNDDVAIEGSKSGAENNGDEPWPSSPSEHPECDMDTCDYMELGSPSSTSQLAPEECDAGVEFEASIAAMNSQSRMDVPVIQETWSSSLASIAMNDDAATEGGKSGVEKNGDERRESSPSGNPTCDMGIGAHIEEGRSPSSTATLSPEECDTGKKIEASVSGSESQSCTGVKVIKETGVSSTLSVMVNDGHEAGSDISCTGKNRDEPKPSSNEHPACEIDTIVHMKEWRSPSSIKETVDVMGTPYSHGDLKKSDFTKSFYEKDLADGEGNLNDPFDDKFWEDSSHHLQSPYAFMRPDGSSYVMPEASKDNESIPTQLSAAFSKVIEGKPFIDHGSSMQRLAASGKLVKQLGEKDGLLVGNVELSDISALTIENRCPCDAVLFGGDTKAGHSPIFPVHVTCDEEISASTNYETPATLGSKGSVDEGDIQDLPYIPDRETARLSDRKEVALSGIQSLDADSLDGSPKSTPKGHEASEQLYAHGLAGVEHENLEVATIKPEGMVNIESLKKKATIKGEDDIVVKKGDAWSTFDHFDEFCERQNEAFLTQSEQPCPRDVASYLTADNSASTRGDGEVPSQENFVSTTGMENAGLSLRKMDMVSSDEDQLIEHNTEKGCAEEETLNPEELPCSVSCLAIQKETPAVNLGNRCEDNAVKTPLQVRSEVSKYWKQKMVMDLGGSPTVMFKSGEIEVASTSTIAKQDELIAGNHSELPMENVADQVVLSNFEESSVIERRRPIGNELEDPKFKESCIHQNASSSLGSGDVGVSNAAPHESIINEDEARTPEEYFEDFCWPFPGTPDIASSQHEVQEVDSQLQIGSVTPETAHSAKSDSDTSEDQNRSSDIEQTEDGNDRVQSIPTQQRTRNLEPSSAVIDNAIRNKENTVGLKMSSTQKHNEKSAVSSRRPLQSVIKTKSEH